MFDALWDQARPRLGVVDEAAADRSYDSDAIRGRLVGEDISPVIPNRRNRTDPWAFDPDAYRERNRAERLVGRLKQFRRVATRYDKLAARFLGFIHLALTVIRLT